MIIYCKNSLQNPKSGLQLATLNGFRSQTSRMYMCMLYITVSIVYLYVLVYTVSTQAKILRRKERIIRIFQKVFTIFNIQMLQVFLFRQLLGLLSGISDMGFLWENGVWVPLTIKGSNYWGSLESPLISWSCPSASSPSFLSFGSCRASPSFPAKKRQFKPVKTFKHLYTCLFNETGMIVATQIVFNQNTAKILYITHTNSFLWYISTVRVGQTDNAWWPGPFININTDFESFKKTVALQRVYHSMYDRIRDGSCRCDLHPMARMTDLNSLGEWSKVGWLRGNHVTSSTFKIHIPKVLTANAPEKWWLEDDPSLFEIEMVTVPRLS